MDAAGTFLVGAVITGGTTIACPFMSAAATMISETPILGCEAIAIGFYDEAMIYPTMNNELMIVPTFEDEAMIYPTFDNEIMRKGND